MADWQIFGKAIGDVVAFTMSGILTGGLYALVALGIVVINKASGVFNFAHGWMMFIGGLFFWQFYRNTPSGQMTVFILAFAGLLVATGIYSALFSGSFSVKERPASDDEDSPIADTPSPDSPLTIVREGLDNFLFQYRRYVVPAVFLGGWGVVAYLFTADGISPLVRGTVGATVACIFIGLVIERFTIRPLLGQPLLTAILMTLAIGFILQGAIQIVWGANAKSINIFRRTTVISVEVAPGIFVEDVTSETLPNYRVKTASWLGKDIQLERPKVWGFGIATTTFVAFAVLFQYTSLGLAMRATSEDHMLAESVGLRVRLILAVAWAMVAVMAGIAGVLQGTAAGLSIITIPFLALRVFPAVLLGGLDSITGAFVGGIVIGIVEKLATLYISGSAGQQMAPYVVLMIVLLIRPEGLFGQKRIERI